MFSRAPATLSPPQERVKVPLFIKISMFYSFSATFISKDILLICLMFLPLFLCYSLIITWELNRQNVHKQKIVDLCLRFQENVLVFRFSFLELSR